MRCKVIEEAAQCQTPTAAHIRTRVHTHLHTIYLFACVGGMVCSWRPEDNLQRSVLPPRVFQGPKLGGQAWWQVPLPTEPSPDPRGLF